MAHLISHSQDGAPRYYSPVAGRAIASPGGGWIEEPKKALAFARASDAQTYLEQHLPHVQQIATIVEHDLEAA